GYSCEELMARQLADIVHPEDLPVITEHMAAMLAGAYRSTRFEKRSLHRDGRLLWSQDTLTLIGDQQGAPDHFVVLVVDINERKRLQEQLHERDALLTSLTRNLPGTLLKFVLTLNG